MNYRHAFHAGGAADVVKHAVLARILVYLREKPAAFRVIDSHAGAGLYDLQGPEAGRSPEWRDGIGKLLRATIDAEPAALLAPYLAIVAGLNAGDELRSYPGSPVLARGLMRTQDRLLACEIEPNAAAALEHNLRPDRRARILVIDGWVALNAYVPPPERRGIVLIDPPFERSDDFDRIARGIQTAHRKWPTGIFIVWYPIKSREQPDMLAKRLRRCGIPKVLRAEVDFSSARDGNRLRGCGLIVINPPWRLLAELNVLLPALARLFADRADGWRIDWIARPT